MSADKLAEATADEEVTTTDSSVPLDHGKLANSKRRRVGRMLETDALATLRNRPAPGVTRTLPLCVDVSRIPIKMLAVQITRYARIAIDRPGDVSYILSPSPAPNRQGTPGRGSRHLRMGGRGPSPGRRRYQDLPYIGVACVRDARLLRHKASALSSGSQFGSQPTEREQEFAR